MYFPIKLLRDKLCSNLETDRKFRDNNYGDIAFHNDYKYCEKHPFVYINRFC